ncbi:MAG: MCE family protein [Myxococcales bacterium]|nr:MCE family protein [Myxococcales bacterium]
MKKTSELRVGIFVMVALSIGAIVVFSVGNRRNVFSPKAEYRAVFEDVAGLRAGSPVQMGGVHVGSVGDVTITPSGKIWVTVSVIHSVQDLIRADTVASIGSKGMLGDRLVDLTAGHSDNPRLPPGSTLKTSISSDPLSAIQDLSKQAGPILQHVEGLAKNLHAASVPLAEPAFHKDLQATVHNLSTVLQYAAHGDGVVHRLFTDKSLANSIEDTLAHVRHTTENLSRTSDTVRSMADEIRHGKGAAHELVYGREGTRLLHNLAGATGELSILLHDVRTTDSTVHDLLYGNKAEDLLENITAVSADFRAISGDLRAGRGTLGGLLVDPSVYEDIKRLVGDLERNEILRALVRYSIQQDEAINRVEAKPRKH